jgi:nucleotide-binding universal stress UspA family protein
VFGAPPVDFLPQQDPVAYEQLIRNAESFIAARFLPRLLALSPDPVVHVVKADVDTDSIGNVVCRKAGDLGAAALVMASHSKSKLQTFFLGSVTQYCCHHSPAPVLVVK